MYENAVSSFSESMKEQWEKNINKLKEHLNAPVEDASAKATKEYEELMALLRSEYIPVDESDELLVLDEHEEVFETDEPIIQTEEEEEEIQSFEGQLLNGMEREPEYPAGSRGTGAESNSSETGMNKDQRKPDETLDTKQPYQEPYNQRGMENQNQQPFPQQAQPSMAQPQPPLYPQYPQFPQYPQYPQQAPIIISAPQPQMNAQSPIPGSTAAQEKPYQPDSSGGNEKGASSESLEQGLHHEPYPPEPIDLSQPQPEPLLEDDADLELIPEDLMDVPLDESNLLDEAEAIEDVPEYTEDNLLQSELDEDLETIPDSLQEALEMPDVVEPDVEEPLLEDKEALTDGEQLLETSEDFPEYIEEQEPVETEPDFEVELGPDEFEQPSVDREIPGSDEVSIEEVPEDFLQEAEESQELQTLQEPTTEESSVSPTFSNAGDAQEKMPESNVPEPKNTRQAQKASFSIISDEVERLFVYLKSLTECLPEEKRHVLQESGVAQKLDTLIQNIDIYKKVNTQEKTVIEGVEVSNRLAKLIDRMREEKNSGK